MGISVSIGKKRNERRTIKWENAWRISCPSFLIFYSYFTEISEETLEVLKKLTGNFQKVFRKLWGKYGKNFVIIGKEQSLESVAKTPHRTWTKIFSSAFFLQNITVVFSKCSQLFNYFSETRVKVTKNSVQVQFSNRQRFP